MWLTQTAYGVELTLKVTPAAKQNMVLPPVFDDAGVAYIPVKITTPAEKGKANKAVIALLAKKFRLAKSSFTIKSGLTSRKKKILITDQTKQVYEMLQNWAK